MDHLAHVERLALSGKVVRTHAHKANHIVGAIALFGAMLHASEHVLLYFEGVGAMRELLVITRMVKEE